MISPAWVRMMARYGAAQNAAYVDLTADLSEEAWWQDRGAFFKSLGATANHILWADLTWLSRLADRPTPPGSSGGLDIAPTRAVWVEMRAEADAEVMSWASGLSETDLTGNLDWVSGLFGAMSGPRGFVITHVFNHATHHRGQIHAMLTAMGRDTPTTDLIFMSEDA
ncbi:MAG: DinB family protein [Jannaschia sp.]